MNPDMSRWEKIMGMIRHDIAKAVPKEAEAKAEAEAEEKAKG